MGAPGPGEKAPKPFVNLRYVRAGGAGRSRTARFFSTPAGLEQEPSPALCLVNPDLQKTRGRNVAKFVTKTMNLAHARCEILVVFAQLRKHVQGRDIIRIVVEHALQPRDFPNGMYGRPSDLPNALGN